jgi:hypothetical protein
MREEIEEAYGLEYPEMLFLDGHDEAIIGVRVGAHDNPVVAYSVEKILENLISQGMDVHEAREFYEFNIDGAFVGNYTPLLVDDLF